MVRLGITGGIGSGKSTVTAILDLLNIPIYIADIESKKLTDSSPIIRDKLIVFLGKDIYKNNKLDKQLLAYHIFSDKAKLDVINSIIHPEVYKHYFEWVDRHKNHAIIALESAILYESGMVKYTDRVLAVYTSLEERIRRTMLRDSIDREKVIERINNQMSDERKIELADFVIYNNEQISLIQQTLNLIDKITQNDRG